MEKVETYATAILIGQYDQSLGNEDPCVFFCPFGCRLILPFKIILTIVQGSYSPVTH